MQECISRLEQIDSTQDSVDLCYNELSDEILWEMDKFKKIRKRAHTPYKPYWTPTLSTLWQDMRLKYNQAKGNLKGLNKRKINRAQMISPVIADFLQSQFAFDKELRNCRRRFAEICIANIDRLTNRNPKDFWSEINKLGPRQQRDLICEALDAEGNITRDVPTVMNYWTADFSSLYGTAPDGEFDEDFLSERVEDLAQGQNVDEGGGTELNRDITLLEVKRVVDKAKKGKATGVDCIPTEVLQNTTCILALHRLFQVCFTSGLLPSIWSKCNIVPIGKGKSSVPSDQLSHRGLAMQCCIFKLYCLLLNDRLYSYAEAKNLLHETQNGFRRNRGCIDHIYSLTEAVKLNLPAAASRVYSCFVDLKKAFPSVNRNLLLWRLQQVGVDGRIFAALQTSFLNPLFRLKLPIGEGPY